MTDTIPQIAPKCNEQILHLNTWLRDEAYRLKGDRRWYYWTLKRIRMMEEYDNDRDV